MKWRRKFAGKLIDIANSPSTFSCFLYHSDRPVAETVSDWNASLPLTRSGPSAMAASVSYGEYFSSIRSFLTADHGTGLLRALSFRLNRKITWAEIDDVKICIQKHGAFYHPARVTVQLEGASVDFVVNVAVSPEGQAGLGREFNNLDRLNNTFPRRYIPLVFYQETGIAGEDHRRFPMFLGEWLSGYHEFHVASFADESPIIQVWDSEKSQLRSCAQKTRLYRRASEILTYYYNPETFEQIFPWHHGAGDFVVRLKGDDLDLRLITVRGYAPLVEADAADPVVILEAMLRFFLHLSLRMRIDRVDGTGDLVWLDETAVEGTIAGFFDGVAQKRHISALAESLTKVVACYILRLSPADIAEALSGILQTYPSQSSERYLMASHLEAHAKTLFSRLGRYLSSACRA